MTKLEEVMQNNFAILNLLTISSARQLTTISLIDAYYDQIEDGVFSNPCENFSMAEILLNVLSARDRGGEVTYTQTMVSFVFKADEQEELKLQSALMACGTTRGQIKQSDVLVRSTS
jgi:hypothetical protein